MHGGNYGQHVSLPVDNVMSSRSAYCTKKKLGQAPIQRPPAGKGTAAAAATPTAKLRRAPHIPDPTFTLTLRLCTAHCWHPAHYACAPSI